MPKKQKAHDLSTPKGWAAGLDDHLAETLGIAVKTTVRPDAPLPQRYVTTWKQPASPSAHVSTDAIQVAIHDWYQMHPAPSSGG